MEARRQIVESMNMLYDTRSEIVHSGRFQVTDTELLEAREYVKHALFTIMQAEPFRNMTDEKQLDAWLEDQLLAGGP